jgi:DNA-binding MarR family transcriptional regulator
VTRSDSKPVKPDGEVDQFVSAILGASWVLVGTSTRSLAEVDDSLTVTQFRTLAVLGRAGQTNLQGLADELQVNASTAMRMVDRLVAGGLVHRHENPATRREVVLSLSPAGEQIFTKVMEKRREWVRDIVMKMPPGDRKNLVKALTAFAAAAGSSVRATPGTLGW